jgi:hypothetical protein
VAVAHRRDERRETLRRLMLLPLRVLDLQMNFVQTVREPRGHTSPFFVLRRGRRGRFEREPVVLTQPRPVLDRRVPRPHRPREVAERDTHRPVLRERTSGLRHLRAPFLFTYDLRRVEDPIRFRDLRGRVLRGLARMDLRRADDSCRRDDERRSDNVFRQRLVMRER